MWNWASDNIYSTIFIISFANGVSSSKPPMTKLLMFSPITSDDEKHSGKVHASGFSIKAGSGKTTTLLKPCWFNITLVNVSRAYIILKFFSASIFVGVKLFSPIEHPHKIDFTPRCFA